MFEVVRPGMVRVMLYGGDTMMGRAVQLTLPAQAAGEETLADSCTALQYLQMAMFRSCTAHALPRARHITVCFEIVHTCNS